MSSKKNFVFSLLFSLVLSCDGTESAANYGYIGIIREFFKFKGEITANGLTTIVIKNYEFLVEYFETDPLQCLKDVYSIGDLGFDEFFLRIGLQNVLSETILEFYIPTNKFIYIASNSARLNKLALHYLFS